MSSAWNAMQEDEQAKAEEELDPAVQERRRLKQAEEWRLQQLKSGASSEENANFQVYDAHPSPLPPPPWPLLCGYSLVARVCISARHLHACACSTRSHVGSNGT